MVKSPLKYGALECDNMINIHNNNNTRKNIHGGRHKNILKQTDGGKYGSSISVCTNIT